MDLIPRVWLCVFNYHRYELISCVSRVYMCFQYIILCCPVIDSQRQAGCSPELFSLLFKISRTRGSRGENSTHSFDVRHPYQLHSKAVHRQYCSVTLSELSERVRENPSSRASRTGFPLEKLPGFPSWARSEIPDGISTRHGFACACGSVVEQYDG